MSRRRGHGPVSLDDVRCSSVRSPAAAAALVPEQRTVRPYGVGVRTETLVDLSRPTDAKSGEPAKTSRTLVTSIYYPSSSSEGPVANEGAASATREGGFPLVVFAPGNGSSPAFYAVLLQAWAAAGYVVAAPTFPLSSTMLPGAGADYVNQPRDISFVDLRADPAQ